MADVAVPGISIATPAASDTVVGVQGGAVKRFTASALAIATRTASLAPVGYPVDAAGAAGDGTTSDTVALRAAITAAGVGGTLLFTPGKTYLVDGSLNPLAGQTLWGYGAKIKRCNEVKSATATAITTGASPTSVTVADGTLFRVGMDVTVYNGASYDPHSHRITAIVGNVLTLGTSFTVAFPSGGTVITAFASIYGTSDRTDVLGMEFDGNRGANTSLAKWELSAAVALFGNYCTVRDTYVHDEVSEGMYVGGTAIAVESNAVVNCGGNGIHFSGCTGAKADGNYVYNTNILGSAPGHADGLIAFSNGTGHTQIVNNYLDTGICGVSSIDTDDNSSVVISGNIIRNCTETAIEGTFPASTRGGKCVISGNMIYDSVKIDINFTQSFAVGSGPYNWIVADNHLENTWINVDNAFGIQIRGNTITASADTTNSGVSVVDSQQVTVTGNHITGFANAVFVNGANSAAVKVAANVLRNNYARGINIGSTATGRAISAEGNTVIVESGYTTNGAYNGIAAQNNSAVLNNVMDLQATSTGSGIVCPNGGASVNGAIVQGNVIRSAGMTYAIRAAGGSQNNWIVGNYTQQTVSNGGGASNTVTGNYTIF